MAELKIWNDNTGWQGITGTVNAHPIYNRIDELSATIQNFSANLEYLSQQLDGLREHIEDYENSIDVKISQIAAQVEALSGQPKGKSDLEIFKVNVEDIFKNIYDGRIV